LEAASITSSILPFIGLFSNTLCAVHDRMIQYDELGRMWKEAVMAYFKLLSPYLRNKSNTSVRLLNLWAKI
jgi:hypothetical protein